MADSIAKLAVVITGDASPLARATGEAQQIVQKFDKSLTGNITTMQVAQKAATSLGGSWAGLAVRGGPVVAVMAAITAGATTLASAADSLNAKLGALPLDTWAGQWKRLKDEIWEAAGIIGNPLAVAAKEASEGLANMVARFNAWAAPDVQKQKEQIEALAAATKKKADEDAKAVLAAKAHAKAMEEQARAAEKARDEYADWQREQFSRAADIKESVRTPFETLKRDIIELRSLFGAGFLDEETMKRAGKAALEAFQNAKRQVAPDRPTSGVAAAERFTMAGFSAMEGGKRELERTAKAAEEGVVQEKIQADRLGQIIEIMRGQKPITLIEGSP